MITTTDLTKSYGKAPAVSSLGWTVPGGSIYGLLGRNGAGKSTNLKMLIGLVLPTSGDTSVGGFEPVKELPMINCQLSSAVALRAIFS